MRPIWALYKRELLSLWVTPLAWVLLTAFLLLQGGIFYSIAVHFAFTADLSADAGPLQAYFGQQSLLLSMTLLLVCPPLTMRLFAEEKRAGTIEGLMTAPISSSEITLAKYAAALSTYLLLWLPTALYAALLRDTGTIDWGAVASGYFGILLVGASYLAIGVLMSALSRSQLVALMLSVLAQFGLFVLGIGEYVFDPGLLHDAASYLSLTSLLEETSKGIIDSRRLVLHGGITAWALFVAIRVVESWRSS